jgi:hypothetical protein
MHVLRFAPLAISFGLLAGVVWWVSPAALLAAATNLDWRMLLPATAAMVALLYFWDAVCLPAVYRVDGNRISYLQSLHLRGLSYFGGALNYELGQAALAWGMARLQRTGLARMLARSVLLAYHDILLLLVTGLIGSLLTENPAAVRLRPFTAIGIAVALAGGGLVWALPKSVRARFRLADAESFLEGWSIARSLRLFPLRFVYFSILVVYASVALRICQLPVDREVVVSTVPLVLLADGLPNFAGLGTRETTLLALLNPPTTEERGALLAMALFWTSGMIVGRFLIAMSHLIAHHWYQRTATDRGESEH